MSPDRFTAVVIGAGQSGLAASHFLTEQSLDHVVLERGAVGNSWRHERWDSLRLLTPNWMTTLPGDAYEGIAPDGFMTAAGVIEVLERYGSRLQPQLRTGVTVASVRRGPDGFDVETDEGAWACDAVVAPPGAPSHPRLPAFAPELPSHVNQLTALQYRRPSQLAGDAGVLVVGASASGV